MKLSLNNSPIPMAQMQPGQFAWCEKEQTIVFATWKAGRDDKPDCNFVALDNTGTTWQKACQTPVQILPPGTQFTLKP